MDRAEQIRRLLISLHADNSDHTTDSSSTRHQRSSALRGPSSSNSSSSKHQAVSKAEAVVDERWRYLKARHGGIFPTFDDRRPDPGCRVEATRYRQLLCPVPRLDRLGLKVRCALCTCTLTAHLFRNCMLHAVLAGCTAPSAYTAAVLSCRARTAHCHQPPHLTAAADSTSSFCGCHKEFEILNRM
jgi:hypothetical protein